MKKSIKIFLLFSFFLSLFSAHAQAPEKMSYQAIIRNASNVLVTNQAVGMRVSILQGTSTGTEVYKELFNPNPQTNINGLVTVEIGSGIPLTGTFAGINWANGPFFIKTETDPAGGTSYSIVGTSQLMSVPYALFAKKSLNNWSTTGNDNIFSNGFIGTTNSTDLVFKRNNIVSGRLAVLNTSFGYNTMISNINGTANAAFGNEALKQNTSGGGNCAFGSYSLNANISGGFNSAFGAFTLNNNTTGSDNAVFGYQALTSNTVGEGNTAVGKRAISLKSVGNYNTGVGSYVMAYFVSGDNNVAIGTNCMYNLTSGSNNIGIGQNAGVPSATGSNQVRIGDTAINYAGIQVSWSITSDRRWKENIQPTNLGLNFIKDLKPVSYTRKNDETKKVEYGIIAQELEASLNKFGGNTNGIITKDDEGMYSVRYNDLLAPMIKAIQEQQIMIEELKKEINNLKNKQ